MPLQILVRYLQTDGSFTEDRPALPLSLGRATDNAIQLPGMMVGLHHASLSEAGENSLRLEASSPSGVEVNGKAGVRSAVVQPGDTISVGRSSLQILATDTPGWLIIDVDRPREQADKPASVTGRTNLASTGASVRRLSLFAALTVLLLAVGLPLTDSFTRSITPTPLGAFGERALSTGRISNAHAHFSDQCSACHIKPFEAVPDSACLDCHGEIAHHSESPAILEVPGFAERRCAECHREHGSEHAIIPSRSTLCASCHADPAIPGFEGLKPAHGFGDLHPEFSPVVGVLVDGRIARRRAPWTEDLVDEGGILFSHAAHLGEVPGPEGLESLECVSCHAPIGNAEHYDMPQYETACGRCHALQAAVGQTVVTLPHGDPGRVVGLLQAAVAAIDPADLAPEVRSRRRPGMRARRGDPATPESLVRDIIGTRVCARCHVVSADGENTRIVQPDPATNWFPSARFDHEPHQAVDCNGCHRADGSGQASDFLLPRKAVCERCHSDERASTGVPSQCIDCHDFHRAATQHWPMGATAGPGD